MRAVAIHSPCHVAVVARDHDALVSVASLPKPRVELAAAAEAQFSSMRGAIIVYMVEAEKLDGALAAARTTWLASKLLRSAQPQRGSRTCG